jgi:hypothetical protein
VFAIGLLLGLAAALGLIHVLTLLFPAAARRYAWFAVVALAASIPFWHYTYPSYRTYLANCANPDMYVVKRNVALDYPFVDGDSFAAYGKLGTRGFKGFDVKRGDLGYVRYSLSNEWSSSACQRDCGNPSVFVWEKTCEVNCLNKASIPVPEFELKSNFASTELIKGRLVRERSAAIDPSGEELAVELSYTYYPYGTGAARLLGLASGEPPKLSCRAQRSIWSLEFIQPKTSK